MPQETLPAFFAAVAMWVAKDCVPDETSGFGEGVHEDGWLIYEAWVAFRRWREQHPEYVPRPEYICYDML